MRPAKAFYFFFFGAAACLFPFLALYYQSLGLSGQQIGLLSGIVPLITLVAAAAWGFVADATQRHRLVLLVAIVGVWLAVFFMSQARTLAALLPLVSLYALFLAPIIPLTDNAVMASLGEQKPAYGRIRVWGAYGWGLAALFVGLLIQRSGLEQSFIAYLVLMVILFFVATRLKMTERATGTLPRRELRLLLSNGPWLLFLGVALVMGISLGIYLNYVFLFLNEMGAGGFILGLSLVFATVSEVPVFLNARRLLARWGAPFLMALALSASVLRGFAYAAMTAPWQVLIISLLHGPTFAAMWSAGVAHADEVAPPGLGATAQGMFAGTAMGLGVALGALSGGYLYEMHGAVTVFLWAGFVSLLGLVVFVSANWRLFRVQVGDLLRGAVVR